MVNLSNIVTAFIDSIARQTFYSKELLMEILKPTIEIILKNHDKTPEEWIDETIKFLEEEWHSGIGGVLDNKDIVIPGGSFALNVNNMNIRYQHGFSDMDQKQPITEQSIFDLASISKSFTQRINLALISRGYYTKDSKVVDLDSEFVSLPKDLTIEDLMRFCVSFVPDDRYRQEKTSEGAIKTFKRNITVESYRNGIYTYCDQGMMILGEVMQTVTGKTYSELFDEYIKKPIQAEGLYTHLTNDEITRYTGSPNHDIGLVNDSKANLFGGVAGHAGVKATAPGLASYLLKENDVNDKRRLEIFRNLSRDGNLVKPNGNSAARGYLGDINIANPLGLNGGDSPLGASKLGYTLQGSTRVHAGVDYYELPFGNSYNSNALLTNPAVISEEYVRLLEAKLNEIRKENAKIKGLEYKPMANIVLNYDILMNGKPTRFIQNYIQAYAPVGKTTDILIDQTDVLQLRLMFIEQVAKAYEKLYDVSYQNSQKTR